MRFNNKEENVKIFRAAIIVTLLFLAPAYAFSDNYGYLRISLIGGDVQINTPDAGEWGLASINGSLEEGDQVWVPDGGRVELQLNTGTYIRLDQNSALQVLSTDKDSSQFYLSQGYAYVYYDAPRGSVIQVDTPYSSVRAFDRAVFRIDMSDQYTDVAVYKGYIEAENKVGVTRINAGQMLSLGQNTSGEVSPIGPPDEWESWNKARNDRVLDMKGESSRYLPSELRAYSYDFDNSGRWVQVPDYGYVWTPTAGVGPGWTPYREGRWIWRGGDYIWVASEPWGWAPYHYGRWAFLARVGWCWVPPAAGEVFWGPGYVGWVRTEDYVAWVPLAPGEVYYGHGHYGPHSVNITNVNINQVKITNVYKNVYVNNGVTVVNRNTFATAAPKIVNINQNIIQQKIFVRNNISVGTPSIRPARGSYFVSSRQISQDKRPPKQVMEVHVKELKQLRPFVKTPDKSVLNPGARLKPLTVNTITAPKTRGKEKPMIQPVMPLEKEKPGASEVGPANRSMKKQVMPEEKIKPVRPEVTTPPQNIKKPVIPEERVKPVRPEVAPSPKVMKKQVMPEEKVKPVRPEVTTPPRAMKKQVMPEERVKPVRPEVAPTPKVMKKQVMPEEKEKHIGPESTQPPKNIKKQIKPEEDHPKGQKNQGMEGPEK